MFSVLCYHCLLVCVVFVVCFVFFFKQKTAYEMRISDWSSDVCSSDLVYGLSMVAVVYTSLVALVQTDMKKLIAYSSVAHMAFVTIGLFAFNTQGIEGAMIVMLSHGLVSGALFLCVGVIYDRLHTREIARYGGLSDNMPRYALLFLLFTMASVGLPGTSGFVGEFLVLLGAYEA